MTAAVTTPDLHHRVEQFLYREAALLDEWRLDEWFALMHPRIEYRIPSPGSDHLDPRRTLQVIHDDHTRLGGRVTRLKSKHAHAESPHSRTRRLVTNVRAEPVGDTVVAHANFHVMRTRLGQLDHFLGTYRHVLVEDGAGFLVRERVATLDHGIVEAGGTVSIIL
ncbi:MULTISPECIES: aromatic-ring-hydroxylating dioxygenase subunit beta [unclassified Amycolatopsis]|uniref:aromatic-ring-hydroxylating dioxygenase subunit beta n=1 Tax=unclassified Amycolatopsis TaxID=2618356 RepID=UPI001C69A9CF|nr:aromatic-ring-hydroxylating dioxygenase subunit beta [Amycolatopsis sp. DSM 110486]QYN19345.1 aromatic-ring-hydroxylating dioxygenase subunit beta [Amycolatopsis sp. DSM 110486]